MSRFLWVLCKYCRICYYISTCDYFCVLLSQYLKVCVISGVSSESNWVNKKYIHTFLWSLCITKYLSFCVCVLVRSPSCISLPVTTCENVVGRKMRRFIVNRPVYETKEEWKRRINNPKIGPHLGWYRVSIISEEFEGKVRKEDRYFLRSSHGYLPWSGQHLSCYWSFQTHDWILITTRDPKLSIPSFTRFPSHTCSWCQDFLNYGVNWRYLLCIYVLFHELLSLSHIIGWPYLSFT